MTVTTSDDHAFLRDLDDRIAELFPVQLRGKAAFRSEYDIPYMTFCNGWEKPQGATPMETRLSEAIDFTIAQLDKIRNPGDVLVWRDFPQIERRGVLTTLYMRLHLLPCEVLRRKLAEAQ